MMDRVPQFAPSELRSPLQDITNIKGSQSQTQSNKHPANLSCILKCTNWVLDIVDITNENAPIKKLSIVSYTFLDLLTLLLIEITKSML
jgi:hypothetical protein